VETIDYITPIVDDPHDYGTIAAANSISDIYAMGARPLFALNLVGFPLGCLSLTVLRDVLRGGAAKMAEAGIPIIGGHTVNDPEPKYGLAVTGVVHPGRVWTNAGARLGDRLVLTKPLGSGVITTAAKREQAPEGALAEAVAVMATLNKTAAEIGARHDIHACTDVTGFGFLGHLHEMTAGSGVGAVLRCSAVPLLSHALELAAEGFAPGGTHRNRDALGDAVRWAPGIGEAQQLVLYDAQTSGGLLFALPASDAQALVAALRAAGIAAAEVGETVPGPGGEIEVLP